MSELLAFLQNAVALAFVALGVVTAISWMRHRQRSVGFQALAIILLAVVTGLGRIVAYVHLTGPFVSAVEVLAFLGSAYALLLYRDAVIPLPRRWHAIAIASLVAASVLILAALAIPLGRPVTLAISVFFVIVWCACAGEPIIRFWLVARRLPAVQAWRLRSLSLGFGALVLALLFAISIGLVVHQVLIQVLIEVVALAIVPLLYASFSPPSWLRRQWRAEEEESVRGFLEGLLVGTDAAALADRALELATRLVGGDAAVLFDPSGRPSASRGMTPDQVAEVRRELPTLQPGIAPITLSGADRTAMALSVKGLGQSGTLVVAAGPFSPRFGGDEIIRAQQLMSGLVTALDRLHLIAQLEQSNAALQEANRHKTVFLANMSHELRTPLNAIIGFSELLTDAQDGQFDEATRRRFLTQILTSGKHLLGLINDILDLSKVEAGQMELRLQPVVISEMVDQVIKTVEPLVAKKHLQVVTDATRAGEVQADPGKLKQMLLNLVSNAIKFTPEGGTITISSLRSGDVVEISVADTGIGIAEADQRQIFQEFHQVDQGPGRKHEGTGLGLALTRRFATLHGGDVRVASRLNKGSVFTISLPLRSAKGPALASPVAAGSNGHGSGPLVLVVEDDPAAAELLTRQLVAAGYRTEVARNGTEALARAREMQPAAITLDIILPDLDGWEVMNRLKSDSSTSGIPIIVVSVVDNPELGLVLGAIDYFVKPVDARLLVERLGRFNLRPAGADGRLRVLVVDDEPANRSWLTKALEPSGFKVLAAAGGREAIEMARAERPDFMVLDLAMPEVTGFDVVEALRADEATREMPIMVLTASNLTEEDKRLLNGRVSEILKRGSVGSADIVGLLKRVVAHRNGVT